MSSHKAGGDNRRMRKHDFGSHKMGTSMIHKAIKDVLVEKIMIITNKQYNSL